MSTLKALGSAYLSLVGTYIDELMDNINSGNYTFTARKTHLGEDAFPVADIFMCGSDELMFRVAYGFQTHTEAGLDSGMTFHLMLNEVNDVTNLHTEVSSKMIMWIENHIPTMKPVKDTEVVVDRDYAAQLMHKARLADTYLDIVECECGMAKVRSYRCDNKKCTTIDQ